MANPRKPAILRAKTRPERGHVAPEDEARLKGTVEAPVWLGDGARRRWDDLAPSLERVGLLTPAEVTLFASWCSLADDIERLTAVLNSEGLTIDDRAHPAWSMRLNAIAELRRAGALLGLDAAHRKAKPRDDTDDALGRLLAAEAGRWRQG